MGGREHEILAEARRVLGGLDFFRKMMAGELPLPPLLALLGIRLELVEPGRAILAVEPQAPHYNGLGTVHGGFTATLLDTALGCAVNTSSSAGRAYATLELKTTFIRPIRLETGTLRCVATAIHVGSRVATAEARIVDFADKLYAHGTATCIALESI